MKNVTIKHTSLGRECSQKYEELTDSDDHKFCDACQSIVIDFTEFSDEELIAYFSTNKQVCGNFNIEQIAKPIQIRYTPIKSALLFIVSSISSLVFSKENINNTTTKPKTEQFPYFKDVNSIHVEPSDTIKKTKKSEGYKEIRKKRSRRHKRIYLSTRFPFIFRGRRLLGCIDF